MNEIVVINDESAEALHAAEFAYFFAARLKKNLVVANVTRLNEYMAAARAELQAIDKDIYAGDDEPELDLPAYLQSLENKAGNFIPWVSTLDASGFSDADLAGFINGQGIYMVVQPALDKNTKTTSHLSLQTLLNKIQCPLMLVPKSFGAKQISRMAYLADLRYSQLPVINFLTRMAAPYNGSVLIAHICTPGLPDIAPSYGEQLFTSHVRCNNKYSGILFSHIKENSMPKTIDTMLHAMQLELLVCSNHTHHFGQLIGEKLSAVMPEHITVPVLVFPY